MKEYIVGNAIICVTRPVLTEAERQKSEARIMTSLQLYGKAMVEKKVTT